MLYARLSGTESGVSAATAQIGGEELAHAGDFWDSLRDRNHRFFAGARCYRLALPFAAAYPDIAGAWLTEWGGAQRWLQTDAPRGLLHAAVRSLGGHLTEPGNASGADLLDKGALKYYRRVKDAFDPNAIFNRGRLFQEIGQEPAEAVVE